MMAESILARAEEVAKNRFGDNELLMSLFFRWAEMLPEPDSFEYDCLYYPDNVKTNPKVCPQYRSKVTAIREHYDGSTVRGQPLYGDGEISVHRGKAVTFEHNLLQFFTTLVHKFGGESFGRISINEIRAVESPSWGDLLKNMFSCEPRTPSLIQVSDSEVISQACILARDGNYTAFLAMTEEFCYYVTFSTS
mmetsp:Transcript_51270/g.58748  ORF Transcript_51270/g.58748 Transcript_51270/m.58748 type:complete len:193 (-) Transcript_51270:119-697(-)